MRNLSGQALASLLHQETDVVWLVLLTISHPDMAAPIRVVNNTENIVSRGNEFIAFPFTLNLPSEFEDAPPQVRLNIDNVDRQIVRGVQSLSSPPSVTLEVVTDADLDNVEIGPFDMSLRGVSYDSIAVEGDVSFEPILSEGYPAGRFVPADFPGLY